MNFLSSRFLTVRNPDSESFWMRMRRAIATVIYPGLKDKTTKWYSHFFTHEYMRSVHEFYGREHAQLNRAVSKKAKRIRQLENELRLLKLQPQKPHEPTSTP